MRMNCVTKTTAFLTLVTSVTTEYITPPYRAYIIEVIEKPVTNGYWLQIMRDLSRILGLRGWPKKILSWDQVPAGQRRLRPAAVTRRELSMLEPR